MRGVPLKTVVLLVILLIPLLLSSLSFSQSVSINHTNYKAHKVSFVNSAIIAGGFQYIDVEVTDEFEKICIIAYHGDSLPDSEDRSIGNYYRWEYDHGIWKDISGHDSVYIKPSQCIIDNNTYYFYIGIDAKAKSGRWTVKILIDGKEIVSSTNSIVIAQFNLFLTALIGIYKPYFGDKKSIINSDFICSDQKGVIAESKKNIDKLIDEVLSKHSVSNQNKDSKEIPDLCFFENTSYYEEESVKSAVSNYPRSKFKNEQKNILNSLFFNKKWCGGNSLLSKKLGSYKGILVIILMIILISVVFVPIITPQDIVSPSNPVISSINVFPDCINLGNSISLNVTVSDSVGISSVVAKIGELDTINLSFIEGNIINDTIYSGFWQSSWLVQDINPGDYTIQVVALNKDNGSISRKCVFTVLPVSDNVNIDINGSLETEFNKPNNITQIEEQNNTIQNDNETIPSYVNDNLSSNITFLENTTPVNHLTSDKVNSDNVLIIDKRHEELTILPGARFYVERTIDGPNGTNITFVPIFSDALTLESIEVIEERNDKEKNFYKRDFNIFDTGKARNKKEKDIEHLKEILISEKKVLNKIAFTDDFKLNSPKKIRLWFHAPSWEEIQSRRKTNSGEISYLIFSGDNITLFDFEGSTWWSSDWGYRKLITVNSSQIDGDLTNFPILINITDSDLASKAQSDGDDIAFVLYSDNSTKLNHEIELFNVTSGQLICWVNVTSLSGSVDTKIWMYYNNSVCSNQQNPTGVWNSNYIAVWHINESGTGTRYDSTSNNRDATTNGYEGDEKITGQIDGADDLEGTNDYLTTGQNFMSNLGSFTLEGWVRPDIWGSRISLYGQNDAIEFFLDGVNTVSLWTSGGGSTSTAYPYSLGTWHYIVGVGDGTNLRLYFDGSQASLGGSSTANYGSSTYSVKIGEGVVDASGGLLNGGVDEVRISNTNRNAIWINTCYNNQKNQSTFITVGNKENITDTSIDAISPYIITYSPYTITATAADILDSVTLWYRYSPNNISWESWTENINDDEVPWFWTFSFPNGTGYYEFYSIGELSGYPDEIAPASADATCFQNSSLNTAPSLDLIYPSPNGISDIVTQPICQIRANDKDGDILTVYWYENSTGSWILRQTNTSVEANSTLNWTYAQANTYSTTYWWRVAVNDSIDNVTLWYYFSTGLINTTVNKISSCIITTSPLDITATGGSDLNNVTLHYRFSNDNSTWGNITIIGVESNQVNTNTQLTINKSAGVENGDVLFAFIVKSDDSAITGPSGWSQVTQQGTTSGTDLSSGLWYKIISNASNEPASYTWTSDNEEWSGGIILLRGVDTNNPIDIYGQNAGTNDATPTCPDITTNTNRAMVFCCAAMTNSEVTTSSEPAGTTKQFDEYVLDANSLCANYIQTTTGATGAKTWSTNGGDNDEEWHTYQIAFRCDQSKVGWQQWVEGTNPDISYPWNWSFDFQNGTGYYEFYSIGRKTGTANESAPTTSDARCYYNTNPAPTIEVINPINGSSNVNLQPICQINANDFNGDSLNICWYENTTGSWVLRQTNSSVEANSTLNWTYAQANIYSAAFWWKVAVNDSFSNTSEIYYFTTLSINTTVDTIIPYIILDSPLNINATGTANLSNVTLYYRWSENNFSWTTLTYDDFEGATFTWGNYSDGGADCLEYTGGTYAHNGNNAADIQDNSGTASSFYYTSGINVDAPGYKYIRVDFWFRAEGMETGEDFWVRYYDGSGWRTVATYVAGTNFVNGQFYHEIVWINKTSYTFPSNMQISFQCDASGNFDDIYIDEIYVNATTAIGNYTAWTSWSNISNPDTIYPWNWSFNFPNGLGYYEFYSIGQKSDSPIESVPTSADTRCYYKPSVNAPIINNYDLRNNTGSKLNNASGLLDVNNEFFFTINITDSDGWMDIDYINITAWYDQGSDSSFYNQTIGGNLNMFLQYENTSGIANFNMLWPDDEVQLILGNCKETIVNENTRIINISFKPNSQVRWASSNDSWDSTLNITNDLYSWNFNITVIDSINREAWITDEYGVYKYTYILPSQDWVDVYALPGFNDSSNIVTITYSSNYNFNMTIYFEENLYNETRGVTIPIANNVKIFADADPNDDITTDITFLGIGQSYAIDIFNESGIFNNDNISQTVNVQFDVYIPLATLGGKYTAHVNTKIIQD